MLLRRYHETDDESPETTESAPAEPPGRSASKADWVAFAVTQGAEQEDAEQLTRDQLIDKYGG